MAACGDDAPLTGLGSSAGVGVFTDLQCGAHKGKAGPLPSLLSLQLPTVHRGSTYKTLLIPYDP